MRVRGETLGGIRDRSIAPQPRGDMAQGPRVLILGVSVLKRGDGPGAVDRHDEAIVTFHIDGDAVVCLGDGQAGHQDGGEKRAYLPEEHVRQS